jgi:hypothetical protein
MESNAHVQISLVEELVLEDAARREAARLCPLRVSANNNSWPAPRRRGYSMDSDGEPRSP